MANVYINESFTGNDNIIEEVNVKETDVKPGVYESLQKTKDCELYQTLEKSNTNQETDTKRCQVSSRKKIICMFLIFLSATVIGTIIGIINLFASTTKTDGSWESWQMWSNCSVDCGCGFRTRSRTCSNPTPSPFGKYCQGNSMDIEPCEIENCADCLDILRYDGKREDGIYTVRTWKSYQPIKVYCDMTTNGGGWTIFQYRFNGSVDFYRNFSEYEQGFGDLETEFWLGLRYIEELASQRHTDLRIDLEAANGTKGFITFGNFSLSAGPAYTLHVGSIIATSRISSKVGFGIYNNGSKFTTYDHDADSENGFNCAFYLHGAWWYKDCSWANLNGRYMEPGTDESGSMSYGSFVIKSSLKSTKMMMRKRDY